jgi:hypothetical protein
MTLRYSPLLLTKVTVTGVLEFCDLTLPKLAQEAACAPPSDVIAARPNAANAIDNLGNNLGMCFSGVGETWRRIATLYG